MNHEDSWLRQYVLDELRWNPALDAGQIEVLAEDGVVTLSGRAASYRQKLCAERIVARLRGVKAIAQDIEVHLPAWPRPDDGEITRRALQLLRWTADLPCHDIDVRAREGWVTMSGTVPWHFQRVAAERSVEQLGGITGVTNDIALQHHMPVTDIEQRIRDALLRQNRLDAGGIAVTARAGLVTLAGRVGSLHERAVALRAAWFAPGVREVADHLLVD